MKKALTLAALFALSAAAQATTVFSDNFDANPLELNKVPAGWTVTDGTVDIIGPGFYSYCAAGQGKCIDLATILARCWTTSRLLPCRNPKPMPCCWPVWA